MDAPLVWTYVDLWAWVLVMREVSYRNGRIDIGLMIRREEKVKEALAPFQILGTSPPAPHQHF